MRPPPRTICSTEIRVTMSSLPLFESLADPFGPLFESVSDLNERIKDTLESEFAEVAVRGEISNLARPRSGHLYFSLKDERASIRVVLWKTDAQRLEFDLADGLSVRLLGRVTLYAPRGDYQIVARIVEPEGIGTLQLAFRQRYIRLAAEGLFDPERKRSLPRFPRRIVVVTSPTGAAVRDVLQVTGRRWPATEFLIAPAKVQGLGSAEEVVAGIELANRVSGVDLILVARGGGSLEDLATFNEESVVRAIAGSRIPVVSAIGHEIDVTLADLAADRRALTPSEAGELCVPDVREVAMHLDRLGDRLVLAGRGRIRDARSELERLSDRNRIALSRFLDGRRNRLARLAASLQALSPLGVLARGYSLTFRLDDDGEASDDLAKSRLIRSVADVRPGDRIRTQLASGQIISRVEESE
jgi:exodeoxyribonuclease VII large subunit